MTEIREPNYHIDLPGEWERAESLEEATTVYRDTAGMDTLSVTLLGVKPVYAMAERQMLLEQYMHHRSQFERGSAADLKQTPPLAASEGETAEGGWAAVDEETGRRIEHRILLVGQLLADFRYTAFDLDEDAFEQRAEAILGSVTASM